MSNTIKEKAPGFAVCFLLALPAWFIGKQFPVVGSAVIAILLGMIIALFWKDQGKAKKGIKFTSKYILQTAVVLLGFGMDLGVVLRTGGQSLPIIISTIATSLILAWVLHKAMHIPGNISTLVGVGSTLGMHDALSLSGMLGGRPAHEWLLGRAELLLVPVVFFVLLLVENSRIPVDDPTTHLELTMIHEVMILDHSGPSLSFIEYGAALKLWFFAALPAGILVPDLPLWQQSLCWLACIFAVAVLVGIVESVMARLRMQKVPVLLGGAAVLSALALILTQVR